MTTNDGDQRMCPDCRGKGQYAGLDITCRRCDGSGMWRPEPDPTTTPRQPTAADDPDWLNSEKGGKIAGRMITGSLAQTMLRA